ncbi:MAG: SMP-30/gluconolactonase/LRE family protein [Betaproteobacteria bacterium]|nr:SMP-30/gluconolactonase/LRE family protein [Betaproteobacteria bacterium]
MFSAPLSLSTSTAFELPGHLHESGMNNPWVVANLQGRDVHSHLKGLCFDDQGLLWVADVPFGRLFRITPSGEWDLIVQYDGWPVGLRFHPNGRLIIADQRHGLLALEVESRQISPYLTHHLTQRFLGINDLTFARNGDCYFTDAGQSGLHNSNGALYRLRAEGELQCLLHHLPGPAGLALTPDQENLLIAMSADNAIWRVPLAEGGAGRVGRFIQLSGGSGPEGLAIDSDGNVAIAHSGLGCAWLCNRRGEPKYRIDSARGDTTCRLTLHPHHPDEIFISEAQTGTILRVTLPMY